MNNSEKNAQNAQAPSTASFPAQASAQTSRVTLTRSGLALLLFIVFIAGIFAGSFIKLSLSPSAQAPAQRQAPQQVQAQPAPQSAPSQAASTQQGQPDRQTSEQIALLEKRVLEHPNDREALVALGDIYFDNGMPRQSIQAYENALRLKADDPNVIVDKGIMHRSLHEHEKALECFERAIAVDPGHRNALFNKGVVLYFDLSRKDEAKKSWEELLAKHPDARTPDGRPLADFIHQMF